MVKKIGFIGAGKVGFSLGKYIREKAGDIFNIHGYYSQNYNSAVAAAAFAGGKAFNTAAELAAGCDLLLLTVPDGQIEDVWEQLRDKISNPLLVGHCSGLQDSRIFLSPADVPAVSHSFGSIHPIMSICDKDTAYLKLPEAYFTIEGDEPFIDFMDIFLSALGNPYSIIDTDKKTLYHAASVMVSNLVCSLAFEGAEVFKACGLDDEFAEKAWRPLFLGNAENIYSVGPILALTGPVERADAETVKRHLGALSGESKKMYLLLSHILIDVAQLKNPNRDYSEIRDALCSE